MEPRSTALVLFALIVGVRTADAQGYIWAKGFGGAGGDEGHAIATDAAGNVYTTGLFSLTADFDPGPDTHALTSTGNYDIYLAKYDADGNYVWAFNFGTTETDWSHDLVLDADNNIYVAGWMNEQGTVDFDPGAGTATSTGAGIFFAKYDQDGNYLLSRTFPHGAATAIALDQSGSIYLCGYFGGTVDLDPGPGQVDLTSNGGSDVFFAKYNSAGDLSWAHSFGGTGIWGDSPTDISVDPVGDVFITGVFRDIVDFDAGAGAFVIGEQGLGDGFVVKYTGAGAFSWAISIGSPHEDQVGDVVNDAAGNLFIGGQFKDSVDVDPGAGTTMLHALYGADAFLAKYDTDGNFQWVSVTQNTEVTDQSYCLFSGPGDHITYATSVHFGEYDNDGNSLWSADVINCMGISPGPSNAVYVAGVYSGGFDFDPGPSYQTLDEFGLSDGFIAKYHAGEVGVPDVGTGVGGFTIYPDPALDHIRLAGEHLDRVRSVELRDLCGRSVLNAGYTQHGSIDVSPLASAVYVLRTIDKDNRVIMSERFVRR